MPQNPRTKRNMAGITLWPNWLGASNTNARRRLFLAARAGACFGGYDTNVWKALTGVLEGPFRVLYNSE